MSKIVNLNVALARFEGHNIRVEGNLELITRDVPGKPRTVLITNIKIDNKEIIDHVWILYSKQWDEFSVKHIGQKVTFVTKVISMNRHPYKKYALGKVSKLQLACVFKNPNQKAQPVKLEVINPTTAQLATYLPASKQAYLEVTATATEIVDIPNTTNKRLILTNMTHETTTIQSIDVPIKASQVALLKSLVPCTIKTQIYLTADLFKTLPYQPVTAHKLKNLTIQKEK